MSSAATWTASRWPRTFDMLRANDLIFNYVASNWLMGQQPPAFDLLAWNGDSTRMPATMHSFYLRSLYLAQRAGPGRSRNWPGSGCRSATIKQRQYVVGAMNDHIVPWQTSYKATHLLGGRRAVSC